MKVYCGDCGFRRDDGHSAGCRAAFAWIESPTGRFKSYPRCLIKNKNYDCQDFKEMTLIHRFYQLLNIM